MFEIVNAASLPVSKNYRTTSFLYKGDKKEGVFAKGLRMKDKATIEKLSFDGDNWEVTATIPSESKSDTMYTVKLYLPLDFECTCPWGVFRFRPCKHVYATVAKLLEIAGADVKDPILRHHVFEGLNRLAYHKARAQSNLV